MKLKLIGAIALSTLAFACNPKQPSVEDTTRVNSGTTSTAAETTTTNPNSVTGAATTTTDGTTPGQQPQQPGTMASPNVMHPGDMNNDSSRTKTIDTGRTGTQPNTGVTEQGHVPGSGK